MHIQALLIPVMALALVQAVHSEQANVAVASNFLRPAERIQRSFEQSSGHTIVVIGGSTGQLAAQIRNGAPYDVLLAADSRRPRLLEREGAGVSGTRFVYAVGRLALWGQGLELRTVDARGILGRGEFRSLALANPQLAPYGMAARQTLESLGLWDKLKEKIVLGQNIGQTYSLVYTGNADIGFVALSQVLGEDTEPDALWEVPAGLHDPIVQEAILLAHGRSNPAAQSFLEYLRGEEAGRLISGFGYHTE